MADGYRHAHPFLLGLAGVPALTSTQGFRAPFTGYLGLAGVPAAGAAGTGFAAPFAAYIGMAGHDGAAPPAAAEIHDRKFLVNVGSLMNV